MVLPVDDADDYLQSKTRGSTSGGGLFLAIKISCARHTLLSPLSKCSEWFCNFNYVIPTLGCTASIFFVSVLLLFGICTDCSLLMHWLMFTSLYVLSLLHWESVTNAILHWIQWCAAGISTSTLLIYHWGCWTGKEGNSMQQTEDDSCQH